jgi:hypothetical protein
VNADGTCSDCDDYTRVSPNGRSCIQTPCARGFIVEVDGQCRSCLQGKVADPTGRNCVPPECDTDYIYKAESSGCVLKERPIPESTERRKSISMVSISPLDRVLSQFTQKDQLIMRVGCDNDFGEF